MCGLAWDFRPVTDCLFANDGWKDMALFVAAVSLCSAFFRKTTVSLIRSYYARLIQDIEDASSRVRVGQTGGQGGSTGDCVKLIVCGQSYTVSRDEYNAARAEIGESSLRTLLAEYENEDSERWYAYHRWVLVACALVAILAPLNALRTILSVFVLIPIGFFLCPTIRHIRRSLEELRSLLESHSALYNRIRNARARKPAFSLTAGSRGCDKECSCARAHLIFAVRDGRLLKTQSPPPSWACAHCPVSNVTVADFGDALGDAEYPLFVHVKFDESGDFLTVR